VFVRKETLRQQILEEELSMTKTLRRALLVGIVAVAAVVATTASAKATAAPKSVGEARITGTKEVGHTLAVSNGKWVNGPTSYTYQWFRCDNPGKTNCQPIAGQTSNRYRLVEADAGHTFYASVTACNRDGCGRVDTDPVGPISANNAPANTAAPTISGSAQVGQTLTAVEGGWANAPTSYVYQWLRCDSAGDNCGAIGGATAKTYVVTTADRGSALRVRITARNNRGEGTATSGATGTVTATGGVAGATAGGSAVSVSTVSLPNQLVISDVKFAPRVLTSRAPFQAQVKVTDKSGRPISGALVYVVGLPYAWVHGSPEVATAGNGIATVTVSPTAALPRRSSVVMFVRVRKPGESLLTGVANRRLVQVTARF
jgi:hypothetical protein